METISSGCKIFSGLTAAYINGEVPTERLYRWRFDQPDHLKERAALLDRQSFERNTLADVLSAYNQNLDVGELTRENIELLRLPSTKVVITGQQAGIFTGPLYTVYKAITAIKLARASAKTLGTPVVPVFWVASEDHDYEEIASLSYLAEGNRLKTLNLPAAHSHKASIGHVELGSELEQLTAALIEDCDQGDQMRLLIEATQKSGEALSEWFARMMALLFQKHGLIFVDPMLSGIRRLQSEAFLKAFQRRGVIRDALEEATVKVQNLGFEPGIKPVEGNTQIFYYYRGERCALKEENSAFYVESQFGRHELSEADLLEDMKNNPDHFSTNVVLRPVFQDRLFPVLSYVGGPGEIAYYGQLLGVFKAMDMEMPIVFPRESFTLVPASVQEAMTAVGLEVSELDTLLCGGLERRKQELLDAADNVHIDAVLDDFIVEFDKSYGQVLEKICGIHSELREMADKNNGIIHSQFEYLRDKAHRFHRKNNKDLLKQFDKVGAVLLPGGKLQERELGVVSFYALMGDVLIEELLNRLPLEVGHRIVRF